MLYNHKQTLIKEREGEAGGLALGCVEGSGFFFGGGLSGFTEEGVDDLDLFWGEDFAGAGVAGGLEGGEEWFVGMDFVGEALACTLLAVVGEIGHSQILLVLVHNNEN